MREVLHWLPASGHISYRVAELVWSCLSDCAPSYLYELACPVSDLLAQRSLFSSAGGGKLLVPQACAPLWDRTGPFWLGTLRLGWAATWDMPVTLEQCTYNYTCTFHNAVTRKALQWLLNPDVDFEKQEVSVSRDQIIKWNYNNLIN